MPDVMRWRYGDTNPVVVPVAEATVIAIGDLVYLAADLALPAAALPDAESLAANQDAFHDNFLGVAMQRSPAGNTQPIRVATTGVFEFDAPAATYEIGTPLGPDENDAGDGLQNQQVAAVPTLNRAIGRCARRVNPAGSRVLVDIVSTVMYGGPQTPAS